MIDPDLLVRQIRHLMYGHLARRLCTVDAPMPEVDKDRYRWSHPDAVVLRHFPFANAMDLCQCPHCTLVFASLPRPQ